MDDSGCRIKLIVTLDIIENSNNLQKSQQNAEFMLNDELPCSNSFYVFSIQLAISPHYCNYNVKLTTFDFTWRATMSDSKV